MTADSLPAAPRSAGWPGRVGMLLEGAAARLRGQQGWRRRGSAFLLGALAALALPPLHAVPLLVVAFTGWLWLIDGTRRPATAFAVGWWFGLGHFAFGVYWVANALLTDPLRFGWMIPPIVGGLAAVLAVFPALAALAARLAAPGLPRLLLLAIAWTAAEWLRGWVFSGFPWNLLGYGWAFSDAMNQFAALFGAWGLSFFTLLAAAAPALLAASRGRRPAGAGSQPGASRAAVAAVVLAFLALGFIWSGGALRLAGAAEETVADVRLRIVQAGIEQRLKGRDDLREAQLARHLRLTVDSPGFAEATHVIWPETAVPFLIERVPEIRAALAEAAPPQGALLTGAPRGAPESGPLERIWNSLVALDSAGRIVGTFDKFHLVPLGEYVPLRELFPFISKITPGSMDFSAGPGPRTLRLPGLPPVSPLICYEVIFPGRVADRTDRPDWLLNLTNDGWFGMSSGPYQHFVSARLRAVEEGLPLVRAANTGISGVIDPYGRVTARLDLGATGVLDAGLPTPLAPTPYARFGDRMLALLLAVAGIAAAAAGVLFPRAGRF